MGADKESLVWACSLARWLVPGNTWIFNMIVYPLCCVNSTLTVSGLRHSGTLCFGTWYLLTHHTWQPLPLWLQNRETSLFTRYERGSLTIWGLMKFSWIRNASACQTLGWKSTKFGLFELINLYVFVDYHSLPRISHMNPWNDPFMTA